MKFIYSKRCRNARALLLLLLALLIPAQARAETFWPDGHRVEITLHTSQAAYMLDQPVVLWLKLSNLSDTYLEMLFSAQSNGNRKRRMSWEMTNDRHAMVRDEALRYLQAHTARPRP